MQINKNEIVSSKWYMVEYIDAAYLYEDQLKKMDETIGVPPSLKTVAHIIENGSKNIVLQFKSQKTGYRLVIPKGGIKNITEILIDSSEKCCLSNRITLDPINVNILNMEDLVLGQKISIDWQDVRLVNSDSLQTTSTPMHIEGLYAGNYGDFIFIYNPENVNIEKEISHPLNKPDLYTIPLNVISNLKLLDTNVVKIPKFQFEIIEKNNEIEILKIGDHVGFSPDGSYKLFATMNGLVYLDEI